MLLIDAADYIGGTLHLSTGSFSAAGSLLQKECDIDDTPAQHFKDCIAINGDTGDHALLRLWIERAAETLDWLLELGLDVDAAHLSTGAPHELYNTPRIITPQRNGLAYLDVFGPVLTKKIESGAVTLRLETEITELIQDTDQNVSGVSVRNGNGDVEALTGKVVVLSSGGFSNNAALWQEVHGHPCRTFANITATGSGHLRAPCSHSGGCTDGIRRQLLAHLRRNARSRS